MFTFSKNKSKGKDIVEQNKTNHQIICTKMLENLYETQFKENKTVNVRLTCLRNRGPARPTAYGIWPKCPGVLWLRDANKAHKALICQANEMPSL